MSNPKIKSEAQRALANIKSYDLKVFALTVNLGKVNLADIDEENDKKKKGGEKGSETPQNEDDLLACLQLIRDAAPRCSILLITDTTASLDLLRIMAYSCDPNLKAAEWVTSASTLVQGKIVNQRSLPSVEEITMKMNEGASTIKEKENALAAGFAFLRSKGLSEDSDDDEDGPVFSLDNIE